MRQIQTDYSLITGGHNVIFKVGMMALMGLRVLRVLHTELCHLLPLPLCLRSRVPDRLVEMTEPILSFDDVEILPVCLGERERVRKTLTVQPGLANILPLSRLKLNNRSGRVSSGHRLFLFSIYRPTYDIKGGQGLR